ncbi:MAG: hypothetical protein QM784_35100 [Polyangiaceae bacterium]
MIAVMGVMVVCVDEPELPPWAEAPPTPLEEPPWAEAPPTPLEEPPWAEAPPTPLEEPPWAEAPPTPLEVPLLTVATGTSNDTVRMTPVSSSTNRRIAEFSSRPSAYFPSGVTLTSAAFCSMAEKIGTVFAIPEPLVSISAKSRTDTPSSVTT